MRTNGLIHRIASGAGDGRNDGAIFARERVEQRRFANVRPSDDGNFDGLRLHGLLGRGESRGDVLQQRVHADAVLGRNGKISADPERIKIVGETVRLTAYRPC